MRIHEEVDEIMRNLEEVVRRETELAQTEQQTLTESERREMGRVRAEQYALLDTKSTMIDLMKGYGQKFPDSRLAFDPVPPLLHRMFSYGEEIVRRAIVELEGELLEHGFQLPDYFRLDNPKSAFYQALRKFPLFEQEQQKELALKRKFAEEKSRREGLFNKYRR